MIDLAQLRREPDFVKAALARRGVLHETVDAIVQLDSEHRRLLQEAEGLRAQGKDLSRQVGEARRARADDVAGSLSRTSREVGERERLASEALVAVAETLRAQLLMIPNLPSPEVPDGADESANVEVRR